VNVSELLDRYRNQVLSVKDAGTTESDSDESDGGEYIGTKPVTLLRTVADY
jgi:hypothetical protein